MDEKERIERARHRLYAEAQDSGFEGTREELFAIMRKEDETDLERRYQEACDSGYKYDFESYKKLFIKEDVGKK